ncbi:MAG: hypothetical protein HN411_01045 [Waddliaceae bacterium]|nr:hypothetical protein [Waddliaceae bacterium]MBT3579660.1 hypothetical protein [Waddliaceae bacterium]MBT4445245.1 hypothetical protein [Waddliaceae bacterium]MBT6928095.1 hypothetical protein [Waddliaceae bacterium]
MKTKSNKAKYLIILAMALFAMGCSSQDDGDTSLRDAEASKERIFRNDEDALFAADNPVIQKRDSYPWEENFIGENPKITKNFFCCKGSTTNPIKTIQANNGDVEYLYDCGGAQKHSLPFHDGKEFIYPILLDILNYIQEQTGQRVVVTCGHRCPQHNAYADDDDFNITSKHMVGAEVDFYVKDMEEQPEEILALIFKFYEENPRYGGNKHYLNFERYSPEKTNVITSPWYNKEVFVKLFLADEGRDLDNRHPYPYIGIQVKYDRDTSERVSYSWKQAFYSYLRK